MVDLTANIWWCGQVEKRLAEGKMVDDVASTVDATLALLADSVLREQPPIRRKKIEALVGCLVLLICFRVTLHAGCSKVVPCFREGTQNSNNQE